jgi:hypothetical protein
VVLCKLQVLVLVYMMAWRHSLYNKCNPSSHREHLLMETLLRLLKVLKCQFQILHPKFINNKTVNKHTLICHLQAPCLSSRNQHMEDRCHSNLFNNSHNSPRLLLCPRLNQEIFIRREVISLTPILPRTSSSTKQPIQVSSHHSQRFTRPGPLLSERSSYKI